MKNANSLSNTNSVMISDLNKNDLFNALPFDASQSDVSTSNQTVCVCVCVCVCVFETDVRREEENMSKMQIKHDNRKWVKNGRNLLGLT